MTWVVKHPATGETIGSLQETPPAKVNDLYREAKEAFAAWSRLPVRKRLNYLRALRLAIVEDMEDIVRVISQSTGKIPTEALVTEVMAVAEAILHIEKRAPHALKTKKVKTPITFIGKTSYVEYKPRGVVLVLSPWNFPFQLSAIPVAEALAGGNTVILKPSEISPLVGVLIEALFAKAGFPKGVLQVAHGGKELGTALVRAKPDYIHFTGSVRTGKIIQAEAAKHLIPTTLELGGKDPMIVFADANLERAVNAAVWGAFSNSGQVCMSVERIYVQRPVYDEFVTRLAQAAECLRQGNDPDDDLGSMTFPTQLNIVASHVKQALEQGARLLTGEHPDTWQEGWMFLKPMIVTNVTQDMDIMQEETFGPVLPVMPFDTEEEAIQLANDSRFGLSASVWTSDIGRGKRVVSRLVTGNAVINDLIITIANPHLPYGGVKEGGLGAYHADIGMQTFCVRTSVMVDSGRWNREVHWFPYAGKFLPFANLVRSFWGRSRNWPGFLRSYLQLLSLSRTADRQASKPLMPTHDKQLHS
ncbi:aldehyde dehydrogenase family protein [Effusibacillus pohliae]|uniref:aldehyde dehydrogenase family protein n=1 Tax=Effusibacillus pohliae TaxID=232270 RepID=UPI0003641C6E|nr:aldehyde dehydrogenase family protein [Effusibacillus pohliae]